MKIIIIGSGAAGMMAATIANEQGAETLTLEKNEKSGKKLYITGKGRCNVTNCQDMSTYMDNIVRNSKFLLSSLNNFTPQDAIDFFENKGIDTKIERGGRVFPESDKASDIIKALKCNSGETFYGITVKAVVPIENGGYKIITTVGDFTADAVIIATGGKSYPLTGSSGDGYKFAKTLGHKIIEPVPALVPLLSNDKCIKELQGLSLKMVNASFYNNGALITSEFGDMIFTDEGVSGPMVLSISSRVNRVKFLDAKIVIDLKPALNEEVLDKRIQRDFNANINKQYMNALFDLLPKSLVPIVIERSNIPPTIKVNQITAKQRARLVEIIKKFEISIARLGDISLGIVTSGGVDTREIDPKTMESKIHKNLYFAGEVIDVDALTGGYNIHIALAMGRTAGYFAANK